MRPARGAPRGVYLRPAVPTYVWSAGTVCAAVASAMALRLYLPLPDLDFLTFNVFLEAQEPFAAYLARLQHVAGNLPLLLADSQMASWIADVDGASTSTERSASPASGLPGGPASAHTSSPAAAARVAG